MRRLLTVFAIALLGGFIGARLSVPTVHAQSATVLQITGVYSTHASCVLPALGSTSLCLASDGLWQSLSGAAFVQIGAVTPTGVLSVTVCNTAGAGCGLPQTGAVSLNIPKIATATVPTVTLQ